ncbi:MAG: thiolase family protein, partial [Gammaproteobacteria bacterium]
MRRAVIVDVVRSPFGRGREDGALAGIHPVDLYAQVLQGLIKRTRIDPVVVEDVITGCVLQVAEQAGNIGRQAVLAAGFPETVPAVTLDRKCGSAQQALDFAAQGVIAGAYDVVIAGGVEMMGKVPMRINRMGKDSEGPGFRARYPQGLIHQGIAAERIAAKWGITRSEQDIYAMRSHELAAADLAKVDHDIITILVPQADGSLRSVDADEGIRPNTTVEKLAALKCAFEDEATHARFPEI